MLHFFEEIYHFHCGHCAVYALVAGLGACTFYSLLNVFGGKYAEGYGYAGLHTYLSEMCIRDSQSEARHAKISDVKNSANPVAGIRRSSRKGRFWILFAALGKKYQ